MKVLIVGLGNIGSKEVRELSSDPYFNVVGAVDLIQERRNKAKQYIKNVYSDYQTALKQTSPDLVRICTSPQTHHELAIAALDAGCDVYIEKIMTTSSNESDDILKTADKNNCDVYVRRNAIYTPVYQRAWDATEKLGRIRDVQWVEPTGTYDDWSEIKGDWLRDLPGGIVSEHLPHACYVVRWFLDGEPDVIAVDKHNMGVNIRLRYKDQTASIVFTEPTDLPTVLRIVGENGYIDLNHSTYRIKKPRGFEKYSIENRTFLANMEDLHGVLKNIVRLGKHAIERQFELSGDKRYQMSDNQRQFREIRSGQHNRRPYDIDGKEGHKNVQLFENIWKES